MQQILLIFQNFPTCTRLFQPALLLIFGKFSNLHFLYADYSAVNLQVYKYRWYFKPTKKKFYSPSRPSRMCLKIPGNFISIFSEVFQPALLFQPAWLLLLKNFPTCTFIPTCTIIQEIKVLIIAALGVVHIWRQMIFSHFWPTLPPSSDVLLVTL